jgi:threonyl-tRNA synthetase
MCYNKSFCFYVPDALSIVNKWSLGLQIVADMQVVGEKIGKAIRNAEIEKIPIVCVIGPRDVASGAVSVRTYAEGELGQLSSAELVSRLVEANRNRTKF